MGHRLEVYLAPEHAEQVIAIAKSFNIDAQIVGHIEEGPRSLTIKSEFGEFNYKGKGASFPFPSCLIRTSPPLARIFLFNA